MEHQRTMPYFVMRTGFDVSATEPKPRGLGRGYRPSHSMSHPPFVGSGLTRVLQRDNAGNFRDNHEKNRLSDAVRKLSLSLGNDQLALLQKEVSLETERLSRSAARLALKMTNRLHQMFHGSNADRSQEEQNAFQNRGRFSSMNDTRRINRHSTFGKAITIPMFWGESVVLYVSWETCWIPMKLLEKVFNCPGVLLGAFSGCFRHKSVNTPDNSVCYSCLRTLRQQFSKFLSNETEPILENLQYILEQHFKHRNGYALHKVPPCCIYQNRTPL